MWHDRELQERHQFVRDSPRPRRHPENRVVHAASDPARDAGRATASKACWRGRGRRNLHRRQSRATCTRTKRARASRAPADKDKAVVMGILERGGRRPRVRIVATSAQDRPSSQVREHVEAGSAILHRRPEVLRRAWTPTIAHAVIDHAVEYVEGNVHTNGMENFWSLLKRGLNGTYVSVEPFHLFRYIDEQAFRFQQPQGGRRTGQRCSELVSQSSRQARHLCGTDR